MQDCKQRKCATSSKGAASKTKKKTTSAEVVSSDNSSSVCDKRVPQPCSSDSDAKLCSSATDRLQPSSDPKSSKNKRKKLAAQSSPSSSSPSQANGKTPPVTKLSSSDEGMMRFWHVYDATSFLTFLPTVFSFFF